MPPTCPMSRQQIIDNYFMEHRAKILDIAAFLDRLDRADGDDDDFRMSAFHAALQILVDGEPQRARRVLEQLSDPTTEPLDSATGMKGAYGAWPGSGS